MYRWNTQGIPHKGWILVDCIDLGANISGANSIRYETCEMCNKEKIRYVHVLRHPDYPDEIHVGCKCASKMTDDYVTPQKNENILRNRANRRINFLKQRWIRNQNGNLVLHYKNEIITAIEKNGSYGFVFKGKWAWYYQGRKIYDLDTLKLAAFDVFDALQNDSNYDVLIE